MLLNGKGNRHQQNKLLVIGEIILNKQPLGSITDNRFLPLKHTHTHTHTHTPRPDGWGVCGAFQSTYYRIRLSNLEYSDCNMKQFAIRHCRTLQPTHTQKEKLEGLWHEPHEWEREDTCGWERRCFYKQLTGQCVQRKIRQFLHWTYIGKYDLMPQWCSPRNSTQRDKTQWLLSYSSPAFTCILWFIKHHPHIMVPHKSVQQ